MIRRVFWLGVGLFGLAFSACNSDTDDSGQGSACRSAADCQAGEVCSFGACEAPTGSGGSQAGGSGGGSTTGGAGGSSSGGSGTSGSTGTSGNGGTGAGGSGAGGSGAGGSGAGGSGAGGSGAGGSGAGGSGAGGSGAGGSGAGGSGAGGSGGGPAACADISGPYATTGSCGFGSCTVAQTVCNITITCPDHSCTGTLVGTALSVDCTHPEIPAHSCTATATGGELQGGSCSGAEYSCNFTGTLQSG